MNIQKLLERILFWCVLIICVVNIIWLASIPREKLNGVFLGFSPERLLLLTVIIFPVIFLIFGVTFSKKKSIKNILNIRLIRYGNILAFLILLTGFLFLLSPLTKFRFQFDRAIWIRLLPVYTCYIFISIIWVLFSASLLKNKFNYQIKLSNRENFIDFTRGFAILLALASHSFYVFGYENIFGDAQFISKSFTRFATPIFVIVTGIMLELVYLRRAQKSGFSSAGRSLLIRSAQCYGAYLVTVFVEWSNQLLNNEEAIHAALFVGKSLFSGILKFYALLLILSILIIWIRQKAGIWIITILPVLVWLGAFWFRYISWPIQGSRLSYFTALVFGHPSLSSFSVWHSITFLSFGMFLGFWIRYAHQTLDWKKFKFAIVGIFTMNLLVTIIAVYPLSINDVVYNFANEYRNYHYLAYYSIGSMFAMVFLWLFFIFRRYLTYNSLKISITTLGKDSLWAFAAGNSLVAIIPGINTQPLTVISYVVLVWTGAILIIHYKNFLLKLLKIKNNFTLEVSNFQ